MADISKTTLRRTIAYLDAAAALYDRQPGLRSSSRAWCIRQLITKLNKKLTPSCSKSPTNDSPAVTP